MTALYFQTPPFSHFPILYFLLLLLLIFLISLKLTTFVFKISVPLIKAFGLLLFLRIQL